MAFPDGLTEHFPEGQVAIEMGLQSYLAVCLRGADGTRLGHLGVLDAGPMEAEEEDVAALRIFASRAAAELERRRQVAAPGRRERGWSRPPTPSGGGSGATCTTARSSG